MDKQKVLHLLKDVDQYVKNMEVSFPKARNYINSLNWKLKEIREEINNPDSKPEIKTEIQIDKVSKE